MTEPEDHAPDDAASRATRSLRPVVVVVAAVVALAVAAVVAGLRLDERSEVTGATIDHETHTVEVDVEAGDVRITAGAAGVVTVERTAAFRLRSPSAAEHLDDGTVRLVASCPSGFLVDRCRSDHVVEVPAAVRLVVRTGAGDIEVVGLEGWLDASTGSGSVTVRAMRGAEVLATTRGGAVSVDFAATPSRIEVVSGGGPVDVVVPEGPYDLYEVVVLADGGPVEVEVATDDQAERQIVVDSAGGAVTLRSDTRPTDRREG